MLPASYSVIKYIADPARDEPHNVGVIAWTARHHSLHIDEDAVERVIRENPRLHPDSLRFLVPALTDRLELESWRPSVVTDYYEDQKGYPYLLTEPRLTTVLEDSAEALEDAVQRLVDRVIRPRRRYGRSGLAPFEVLERRIQPLLQAHAVSANHFFVHTNSGVPRRVDFFANHGASLAIETLKLDLKRGKEIVLRADAQANKINDIKASNAISVLVFATFSDSAETREVNQQARQIIASSEAQLVDSIDEAVDEIATASARHI